MHTGKTPVRQKGFTVLELLLSVSIFALMISIMAPVYLSYLERVDSKVAEGAIREQISRASAYAYSNKREGEWGVYVAATSTTLYAGPSYAQRIPHADEVISFSSRYGLTGAREVQFSSARMREFAPTSITLVPPSLGSRTIVINRYGVTEAHNEYE
jgi:prepilin-type N-terminal cleavage/methylation domain-containing protein